MASENSTSEETHSSKKVEERAGRRGERIKGREREEGRKREGRVKREKKGRKQKLIYISVNICFIKGSAQKILMKVLDRAF